ncbi:MAG: hypothetical protein ACYC3X_25420 [Pirellulaceae bacterium]
MNNQPVAGRVLQEAAAGAEWVRPGCGRRGGGTVEVTGRVTSIALAGLTWLWRWVVYPLSIQWAGRTDLVPLVYLQKSGLRVFVPLVNVQGGRMELDAGGLAAELWAGDSCRESS